MESLKLSIHSRKIETSISIPAILDNLKDKQHPFVLESPLQSESLGRFSFIGFDPFLTFTSKNNTSKIINHLDSKEETLNSNPLDLLNSLLNKYQTHTNPTPYPFIGGAVGFFAYDLSCSLEKIPAHAIDDTLFPDISLGFYDGIIAVDHLQNQTHIIALGIKAPTTQTLNSLQSFLESSITQQTIHPQPETPTNANFHSNFTKEKYIQSIQKIKQYLASGDIYQINLTQRFTCDYTNHPLELYKKLRSINPSPFACYLDFQEGHIISSSPERFLKLEGKQLETRPIKGTRPRTNSEETNTTNKDDLLTSEKEKAELLMIVDLERNDLSKVSIPGSVKVTQLYKLEEHPTVFHMSSIIQSTIKDNTSPIDILKATFPGGSITGTPKIRAMEIIEELEPTRRGIYTGSIGYISFNGNIDLNIAIRTIVKKDNKLFFQVGGGIVWDSEPEFEYQETLHKAKALFQAISS